MFSFTFEAFMVMLLASQAYKLRRKFIVRTARKAVRNNSYTD